MDSSRRCETTRTRSMLTRVQHATSTIAALLRNKSERRRVVASHRPGQKRARAAGRTTSSRGEIELALSNVRADVANAARVVAIDPASGRRPTAIRLANARLAKTGRPIIVSKTVNGAMTSMGESPYQSINIPLKSAGATPTTVAAWPLRSMVWPTMSG